MVQRVLLASLVSGCALYDSDDSCEPYIDYDRTGLTEPFAECRNVQFYEIPVRSAWYPVDTQARVQECKPGERERLFICRTDGSWGEFPGAL